jgi:hypothetical protein
VVKLALGMIVFNGMPFVEGVLKTWYPHVEQIVVAEGPVEFWVNRGYRHSTDGTLEYLCRFPDPDDKITTFTMEMGHWKDKLEMCQAWYSCLNDDITHVAVMDADEFMLDEDILHVKKLLNRYDSVGLMLRTFVGGFDRYLTGFEQKQDTIRFLHREPGDEYVTHRPPTIGKPHTEGRHLDSLMMAQQGIYLYHYSHVLPSQVKAKELYYASYMGNRNVIPDYYEGAWKPWVLGDDTAKKRIEQVWGGIHDFHPCYRGECRSATFYGRHPWWIERNRERILEIQKEQINEGNPQ